MTEHVTTARIERAGVDREAGTFRMILATEGEASDGHILSIAGGTVPERMPLLMSHWNDPLSALGSVTNPSKDLKSSPPELRAIGQIELEGEGTQADIRRDVFHMISEGHLDAVSIRWDEVPGKTTLRVNLPEDHPHHVSPDDPDWRKVEGAYFEAWTGREGSIVALGADPAAIAQRADQTEGDVSTFWRVMAEEAESDLIRDTVDLIRAVGDDTEHETEIRATDSEPPADQPAPEVLETAPPEPPTESARPRVRWEPGEVARALRLAIDARADKRRADLEALIFKARGRVTAWRTNPSPRPNPRE